METAALADRIVEAAGSVARARAPAPPDRTDRVDLSSLAPLPPPVRRYFDSTLRDGQRVVRVARLETTGTFRHVEPDDTRGPEEGWIPFTAIQTVTVDPPGLVWAARMRMLPFVDVDVRDAYAGGRGTMQAAIPGLWQFVDEHESRELDAGALLRHLAESAWLPTALLPGPRLVWNPTDATHARATLRDGATEVSATFEFGPAGEIVSVTAERHLAAESSFVLTPWNGRFWQHEVRAGMRIPVRGEVSWLLDGEWRPYWRGRVVRVDYDFAPEPEGRL